MGANVSTMFRDVGHARSPILLLSLTDPDKLKQSKFTAHEINIIKKLLLLKNNIVKNFLKEKLALKIFE